MNIEIWKIIAAVAGPVLCACVGAVGLFVAQNFDSIRNWLKAGRRIQGDYDGVSFYVPFGNSPDVTRTQTAEELHLIDKYVVEMKQKGQAIKATMKEIEISDKSLKISSLTWKGILEGDFLRYRCTSAEKDRFLISTGVFHILPGGKKLTGFFVSNGEGTPSRGVWAGYAELTKRG